MPNISVIVTTKNSGKTIEECLKAIRSSACSDYELIIVDSSSDDETCYIADRYADKIIKLYSKTKRIRARGNGVKAACGNIIVNVDSDILVKPDTLDKINIYFSKHLGIDAVTGLLAKEHPHRNFFSQYKNLYMNYIFSKLPDNVNFLYGSIHAIRKASVPAYDSDVEIADDTALGQQLVGAGKKIAFLNDLEVVHLKKYNLFSFIKNDFQIPFDWAKIFLAHKGWQQLGRNKTGFAHSPKEQLVSVILAPLIVLLTVINFFLHFFTVLILFLFLTWIILNVKFLNYLRKEKGLLFVVFSFFVTFFDNIIMSLGILSGLWKTILQEKTLS